MTESSPSSHSPRTPSDLETEDEHLGWEGHVHMPDSPPLWTRVLKNWPELRTGLAFSLVFAAGTIIGCSLATFLGCQRKNSIKS